MLTGYVDGNGELKRGNAIVNAISSMEFDIVELGDGSAIVNTLLLKFDVVD